MKLYSTEGYILQGFDDCSDITITSPVGEEICWSKVVLLYHKVKEEWGEEASRLEEHYLKLNKEEF